MGLYILKSFTKARCLFGNVIHDFRAEEIRLNIGYFFNPKSLVDGILPLGRNCFTCLKIGHQTKDCPIANSKRREKQLERRVYSESNEDYPLTCYRCRKVGHIARDCQEEANKQRNKSSIINTNNTSSNYVNVNNNNSSNNANTNANSNFERCFTCHQFGHFSRDCKKTVVFTAQFNQPNQQQQQQQQHYQQQQQHQQQQRQLVNHQPAPITKMIQIMNPSSTVNPPILLQQGEKYQLVINKNPLNNMLPSSSAMDQNGKNKVETRNVYASYQDFYQAQSQANAQNPKLHQPHQQQPAQLNRQNSNQNSAKNVTGAPNQNTVSCLIQFFLNCFPI